MKVFIDSGLLIEYEKQTQTCTAEGIQLIRKVSDLV